MHPYPKCPALFVTITTTTCIVLKDRFGILTPFRYSFTSYKSSPYKIEYSVWNTVCIDLSEVLLSLPFHPLQLPQFKKTVELYKEMSKVLMKSLPHCWKTCSKLEGKHINMKGLRIFLKVYSSQGDAFPESSSIHNIFCAIIGNKLWDSWNYYALEKNLQLIMQK